MGRAHTRSSKAGATGAPPRHKQLNHLWLGLETPRGSRGAPAIITTRVSSIVMGLRGEALHSTFMRCQCLWGKWFLSQSADISHNHTHTLLPANISWHRCAASSVLMKIWLNEFKRLHFFPLSISCKRGSPERKYPLITANVPFNPVRNVNVGASWWPQILIRINLLKKNGSVFIAADRRGAGFWRKHEKKNTSVVWNQPCFFATALENTIMQTESGTLVLKQSIMNYKTLLQTDGPSPVRRANA